LHGSAGHAGWSWSSPVMLVLRRRCARGCTCEAGAGRDRSGPGGSLPAQRMAFRICAGLRMPVRQWPFCHRSSRPRVTRRHRQSDQHVGLASRATHRSVWQRLAASMAHRSAACRASCAALWERSVRSPDRCEPVR
jgi:hypothetical protein